MSSTKNSQYIHAHVNNEYDESIAHSLFHMIYDRVPTEEDKRI